MKYLPILSLTALSVSSACAENFDPAPFELTDGISLIPQIEATVRYDDNIYNEETDVTSSSIFLLSPSFMLGTDDGINRYGALYKLSSGTYSNSSDDNFVDHNLSLYGHTEFSDKQRTDFNLAFENTHEDRGSKTTEGDASSFDEPIKYNLLTAQGYFQYGGINSIMRVGGGLSYTDKTFTNFESTTKYRDVGKLKIFTDADYQIGSVTYLTLELNTTDAQYDYLATGSDSLDNRDTRVLFGARWDGLAKTTGIMKAGYQYKTFDSDNRDDFSGATVEVGVEWKPVEHTSFTANVNKSAEDSDTVGDYIDSVGGSLSWNHDWTTDFDSSLQFIYANEDYVGTTREDDTTYAMLYLNYDLTRWMQVKAGYEYTTKDSNSSDISYDKNAVSLGVVVAL
ncbi:outer membrane beta-barrel protein [Psychromonas sp. KJ10-10]|uniref:outer membrane beta-barrel protein n=1 Tax=Psychromonas sp. KJ10-10 TaxID=3391823 RepID=UPI0039B46C38